MWYSLLSSSRAGTAERMSTVVPRRSACTSCGNACQCADACINTYRGGAGAHVHLIVPPRGCVEHLERHAGLLQRDGTDEGPGAPLHGRSQGLGGAGPVAQRGVQAGHRHHGAAVKAVLQVVGEGVFRKLPHVEAHCIGQRVCQHQRRFQRRLLRFEKGCTWTLSHTWCSRAVVASCISLLGNTSTCLND